MKDKKEMSTRAAVSFNKGCWKVRTFQNHRPEPHIMLFRRPRNFQRSRVEDGCGNGPDPVIRAIEARMGQIRYFETYFDDTFFEYRHVLLPPEVTKLLPRNRLLSESEWRAIGVQQSRGWVHYAIHRPEPHIMLFRRPRNFQSSRVEDGCTMQFNVLSYTICSVGGLTLSRIKKSKLKSAKPSC